MLILMPCWIVWHFSSGLSTPTLGYTLQASLFSSPEKSFLLHVYAEAMARAFPPKRPTSVPCHRHVGDPRVLNFLDISATVNASFPADCSNSESNSLSGEIKKRESSMSRPCSEDSMSPSS
jgi:hypothetical protein